MLAIWCVLPRLGWKWRDRDNKSCSLTANTHLHDKAIIFRCFCCRLYSNELILNLSICVVARLMARWLAANIIGPSDQNPVGYFFLFSANWSASMLTGCEKAYQGRNISKFLKISLKFKLLLMMAVKNETKMTTGWICVGHEYK